MANPIQNLPPQVVAALQRGNLLEAIKLLRQAHPELGLAEVKSLIEALQRQAVKVNVKADAGNAQRPASVGMPHHHHAPSTGLPPVLPGLSPGEMPRASGTSALLGAAIAILAVIAAAIYFSG